MTIHARMAIVVACWLFSRYLLHLQLALQFSPTSTPCHPWSYSAQINLKREWLYWWNLGHWWKATFISAISKNLSKFSLLGLWKSKDITDVPFASEDDRSKKNTEWFWPPPAHPKFLKNGRNFISVQNWRVFSLKGDSPPWNFHCSANFWIGDTCRPCSLQYWGAQICLSTFVVK